VLGQAHAPRRRAFGIAVAASCVLVLSAVSGAGPPSSGVPGQSLRAENAALASRERSAVLGLYALDSELARARTRLADLERRADVLRREQVVLQAEMKVAMSGARTSEQRLASRVRLLFDHGETSAIEIVFGARSLDEALVELDSLEHVTSINNEVLSQLGDAKARITRCTRALAARSARLAAATRAQEQTTLALEATRAERTAYIADLRQRQDLNSLQIVELEAQARAATVRSERVVASTTAPAAGAPAPAASTTAPVVGPGRTLTVSAVAYSLPGHTASGLPVGMGIVAVDPSVIPLGTHMTVPGYGEAVAADTGSAVRGAVIDLWFPTLAKAQAWGRRSVTITLG